MSSITREEARKSLIQGAYPKKHICETLRLIYDEVYGTDNEVLIELLVDAVQMAKKMRARLDYYQDTYKDETGSRAKYLVKLPDYEAKKKMRKERVM